MRFLGGALLAALLLVGASVAQAQPDPKKVEADKLYNDGNSLFRAGNYPGAIEKYRAAIDLAKDFKYYYQLGLAYKNSRQNEKAIEAFEGALKLKSDFALGYNALGGTLLGDRIYDKAIDAFKQALKHDPNMGRAKQGIGEAYAGQAQQLVSAGRIEAAGELVDEALQQHSNNDKLYILAAMIYNKLEKPEKALMAAEEAIKLQKRGNKGAAYFELGIAHKKLKDIEKARMAFLEAKKDPTYSRNAQYELDGLKSK